MSQAAATCRNARADSPMIKGISHPASYPVRMRSINTREKPDSIMVHTEPISVVIAAKVTAAVAPFNLLLAYSTMLSGRPESSKVGDGSNSRPLPVHPSSNCSRVIVTFPRAGSFT